MRTSLGGKKSWKDQPSSGKENPAPESCINMVVLAKLIILICFIFYRLAVMEMA